MPDPADHPPFVGRAREVTGLEERLVAAAAGHGGLVLLAGEPGIGKSRLLAELALAAAEQGWFVLTGRAYEDEGVPSYLPFVEALRGHMRRTSPEALLSQLGGGAADVALLLPELRQRLPAIPATAAGEPDRYRLFESVCDALLGVARDADRGLLLTLDDLHWADKPTLLLLLHLARRVGEGRLLVAGAYRTTDLARSHPLSDALAELRRERLYERLPVGALDDTDAHALIAGLGGAAPSGPIARAIVEETQGNPFFIEEVVRHLHEQGRDLTNPRAAVADWGIPEGVREVIGKRLSHLRPETNQVLRAAAVLGEKVTFDVLLAMEVGDWSEVTAALEEATAAGVLHEDAEGYRFAHALVRQTLLEELSLPRRQRLHLQSALALERTHARNLAPHVAALAGHYRQAGAAANPEKALAYARQAAEAALAVFAWEEAALHWQAGLEAADASAEVTPHQRCELLLALGQAQWRAAAFPAWKDTFLQAARAGGTPEQRARAALGYAEVAGVGREATTAIDLLEEALAALGDGDSAMKARTLGLLAEVLLWRGDRETRSLALSAEAVAMARRLDDPYALAFTLNERHWALTGAEHLTEREVVAAELIQIAERIGDTDLQIKGHRWQVSNLFQRGNARAVDQEVEVVVGLAERFRQPHYQIQALTWQITQALRDGQFADFERYSAERDALADRLQSPWALLGTVLRAFAQDRRSGRPARNETSLREAVRSLPAFPLVRAALALLLTETGRMKDAGEALDALGESAFQDMARNWMWLPTLTLLAQVSSALGDQRHAKALYILLLPLAGMDSDTFSAALFFVFGAVDRFLGLLAVTFGRQAEAEQHFEAALAMNLRTGTKIALADTQRQYAEMLLARGRRGDAARARELLEQALAIYDEIGMDYWAGKTRALLERAPTGAGPRPALPDGLSVREAEVLRLLAGGKSNAEIAEALVLSVHTVERHVANLYGKIGAHGRADATAYAVRRGIV